MTPTDFGGGSDGAVAVALQPNGKIVAAGVPVNPGIAFSDFALARYNTDGSLDTTFGGDGKVTTDFGGNDVARAVAVRPDGKIVVAGVLPNDFALARYNADGSLDTTFGGDGKVTTDFGSFEQPWAVALQPDGKIVAAGVAFNPATGNHDFAVARYLGRP